MQVSKPPVCLRADRRLPQRVFKKTAFAFVLLAACLQHEAEAATAKPLVCAVITEQADWDKQDIHGDLSPLAAEICSAVALAAHGRGAGLRLLRVPAEAEALAALRARKADLAVGVTPSISAGRRLGIMFGPPVFWDTQAIMVHRQSAPRDAAGLSGRIVCFLDGTDPAAVLLATMKARGIAIRPFPFQEEGEMEAAFAGGGCQAMTGYASRLAEARAASAKGGDFAFLPDRLAASPAVVATRRDDPVWSAVVAATVDVLVQAEMLGVTQAGAVQAARSDDPVLARLLGRDWSSGLALGLARDWSARVIGAVGNYGELYARTLGMRLPVGLNADCLHGGAMCAAQIR